MAIYKGNMKSDALTIHKRPANNAGPAVTGGYRELIAN